MKVKIGDKVYDAEEEPILLILDRADRRNIANMDDKATKYCAFPDKGYSEEDIRKWMNEGV